MRTLITLIILLLLCYENIHGQSKNSLQYLILSGDWKKLSLVELNLRCSFGLPLSGNQNLDRDKKNLIFLADKVRNRIEEYAKKMPQSLSFIEKKRLHSPFVWRAVEDLTRYKSKYQNFEMMEEDVSIEALFRNPKTLFLNGYLDPQRQQAFVNPASASILILSVGRMLGYPLKLVPSNISGYDIRWEINDQQDIVELKQDYIYQDSDFLDGFQIKGFKNQLIYRPPMMRPTHKLDTRHLPAMSRADIFADMIELRAICFQVNGNPIEAQKYFAYANFISQRFATRRERFLLKSIHENEPSSGFSEWYDEINTEEARNRFNMELFNLQAETERFLSEDEKP